MDFFRAIAITGVHIREITSFLAKKVPEELCAPLDLRQRIETKGICCEMAYGGFNMSGRDASDCVNLSSCLYYVKPFMPNIRHFKSRD